MTPSPRSVSDVPRRADHFEISQAMVLVEAKMVSLLSSNSSSSETSKTLTATREHLASGGHRVRAKLALQASQALGLSIDDAVILAATSELLHNASLIHDDLQDREQHRRGAEAVWVAYGEDVAICAGDLLISAAYGVLASFSNPQSLPALLKLVHERTAEVIHGQCSDLAAKADGITDIEIYKKIVVGKSGALLSLPLELAFAGAGEISAMALARQAAADFAIGYQVADDMNDIERDLQSSPHCVNALIVLRSSGDQAHAQARELALNHLKLARETASTLPNDSGRLLKELATQLAELL